MSGYWVLSNAFSSSSSCWDVNVVLDRLCFLLRGIPGSLSQSDPPSLSDDLSGKRCKNLINRTVGNSVGSIDVLELSDKCRMWNVCFNFLIDRRRLQFVLMEIRTTNNE